MKVAQASVVAVLGLLMLSPAALKAQPTAAPTVAEQRASIQAERQRLEARFDAELAACRQRFAVTACVDDARLRRREALAVPRARELVLDDTERQQRAQARRQAVRDKQLRAGEAPAPAPSAAARMPERPARALPASVARAASASASASAAPASAAPVREGSAAAAQRVEAARIRRERASQTQQRIDERQAERARKGRVSAPLSVPATVPGAASAAR